MNVNFEFLGEEPIENIVTCMNFSIDKVVYFGYTETIEKQRNNLEKFLKNNCGVKTVVFYPVSQKDFDATLNIMRDKIVYEYKQGNDLYFDITGGESLILVAFGMLSKEFKAPMHMYDIPTGNLIEFDTSITQCLSKSVKVKKIAMTLDLLVEMHGGKINENLNKRVKDNIDQGFHADIGKIYTVAKQYWDYWHCFSEVLRTVFNSVDDNFMVSKTKDEVRKALLTMKAKPNALEKINEILNKLSIAGVLLDVTYSKKQYRFRFKNQNIKDCLWEAGSILELHTYLKEYNRSDECRVGVHLDWDGIIHDNSCMDVTNEIDVLKLNGYVPTFISCKSGKMGPQQTLHALYELDMVAKRFGGKYARKVLVTARGVNEIYMERAKEMGIEVR